jgi:hypothetical protein
MADLWLKGKGCEQGRAGKELELIRLIFQDSFQTAIYNYAT